MLKKIRIFALLFVLVNVALGAWLAKARSTDWDKSLNVAVFVINGDDSEASAQTIDQLLEKDDDELESYFADIENFFAREADRYDLPLARPVDIRFAGELAELPPQPPQGGSTLSVILWSLKLRYWAWRHNNYPYLQDAEIYVLYYDPEQSPRLAHSLGLKEGLIGVVNAFAGSAMKRTNHVVIAHELLHTVGATDKYDPTTTLPLYPTGYAEPDLEPLHPQSQAELMAGRIPQTAQHAEQARRLRDVVVGPATAKEINWISGPD